LIGKPVSGSKNKTFVISHKSEEERTRSLTSKTRWLLAIGIALLVLAVVLAGIGIKVGA
jgi:predicted anti-sigma-YlaC factor YlaD